MSEDVRCVKMIRVAMIRVALCRDARSERPLCQGLRRQGFNGDGRLPSRHTRASPYIVTRETSEYCDLD